MHVNLVDSISLDVLIPTYNRCNYLKENLRRLRQQISTLGIGYSIRIVISDNASDDTTMDIVKQCSNESGIEIQYFRNPSNLGIEANFRTVLARSTASHVMFLGDDDFLADGYLARVMALLNGNPNLSLIIPGMTKVSADGPDVPVRNEAFLEKCYPRGSRSAIALSGLAHQMSGLVYRREGLLEAYCSIPLLKNLYPFIFWACISLERGNAWYLPSYKTLVFVSNTKDWRYDDSGLLNDIFRNYKFAYSDRWIVRCFCEYRLIKTQSWRLRRGNIAHFRKACLMIINGGDASFFVKVYLAANLAYRLLRNIIFRR